MAPKLPPGFANRLLQGVIKMAGVDLYVSQRQSIHPPRSFAKHVSVNLPQTKEIKCRTLVICQDGPKIQISDDTRHEQPPRDAAARRGKAAFYGHVYVFCTCFIVAEYTGSRQRTGVPGCATAFISADVCFCEWQRLEGRHVSAGEAERLSANE